MSDLVNGLFAFKTYQDAHHLPFETLDEANQIAAGVASDPRNDVWIIISIEYIHALLKVESCEEMNRLDN